MQLPDLIIAADWSTRREKRWMSRAILSSKGYAINHPTPVGSSEEFLARVRRILPNGGTAIIGFDFPIGLPMRFMEDHHRGKSFRTLLEGVGEEFFIPANDPVPAQPFGPAVASPGIFGPDRLAELLGFEKKTSVLLRECDRHSGAHPMFYTLGPRQVGRAALDGWRCVLRPDLQKVRLWPFDGTLAELLDSPGVILGEIYPALYYGRPEGRSAPKKDEGKETADARKRLWQDLWLRTRDYGFEITLTPSAADWIDSGFASSDDFDSMVGVLGILRGLALGDRQEPPPDSPARRVEGWMLGLEKPVA